MTQLEIERRESCMDSFRCTEEMIRIGIVYLCGSALFLGALLFTHRMALLGLCVWWGYKGRKLFLEGRRLRAFLRYQFKRYPIFLKFQGHYRMGATPVYFQPPDDLWSK